MGLAERLGRRRRGAAAVLALVLSLLLLLQIGVAGYRASVRSNAEPAQTHVLSPAPAASPAPSVAPPSKAPAPRTERSPRTPAPQDRLHAFGGLGAWVDVYDFATLDPRASVAALHRRGVRTLYIQTGRYNTATAVVPEVGPWLRAAHALGIKVVGWYLPSYKRMAHDVRRTRAIATYRSAGEAFDGLGIDIEFKGDVRHVPTWNARVAEHARRVREALGASYPIAAIAPPPLQMDVAPSRWDGFPWRALGRHSDVIMLMSYWSFRDCPNVRVHCARPFTRINIERTRELTGRPGIPIHTIGGVADVISTAEVRGFVQGSLEADAYGASLYDLRTTKKSFWPHLEKLATL